MSFFSKFSKGGRLRKELEELTEQIFKLEWSKARPGVPFSPSSSRVLMRESKRIEKQIEILKLQKEVQARRKELQSAVTKRREYLQQLRQQVRGQGGGGSSNS